MEKLKVVFLSEGNCCRSQMAEGFAKKWGKDVMVPMSAGLNPDSKVKPEAVKAMKEAGIDISMQKPKAVDDIEFPDVAISMDAEKPSSIPGVTCIEWSLANPEGKGDAFYKRLRDIIASRVRVLIQDIKDGDLP
jgi:protein-tyrosine-phosphatase